MDPSEQTLLLKLPLEPYVSRQLPEATVTNNTNNMGAKAEEKEKLQNYFKLQMSALKALGLSFNEDEGWTYRVCGTLWLASIFIYFTVVELFEIYKHINDLDMIVNFLSYMGTDILGNNDVQM